MPKKDAFAVLKQDHRDISDLLETMIQESKQEEVSKPHIQKLQIALTLHTQIEEKLLYPKAQKEPKAKDLIDEAYKEHEEAKQILSKITPDQDAGALQKYCQQLLSSLEHHIKEEEQELFPLLERLWDEETLSVLNEQIQQAHEKGLEKAKPI